jgi:hypothetical protein
MVKKKLRKHNLLGLMGLSINTTFLNKYCPTDFGSDNNPNEDDITHDHDAWGGWSHSKITEVRENHLLLTDIKVGGCNNQIWISRGEVVKGLNGITPTCGCDSE